jgi:hypothetical protein
MAKKEEVIIIKGFDPAGEPTISVQTDGSLQVAFNFMPPSYMDNPDDLGVFSRFDAEMQAFIGVPVQWDDREIFVISAPKKDTIKKITEFLQAYMPDIDHISGLWLGYYEYQEAAGKTRVAFSIVLKRTHQMVTGKSIEAQTFGVPTKDGLTANFVGNYVDGKLYLVKTYDGSGGQSHSFSNHLSFDEKAKTLTGTWAQVKDWHGKVFMKKVDKDSI